MCANGLDTSMRLVASRSFASHPESRRQIFTCEVGDVDAGNAGDACDSRCFVRLKEAVLNDHNKAGCETSSSLLGGEVVKTSLDICKAVSSVLQLLFVVVMINHYVGLGP